VFFLIFFVFFIFDFETRGFKLFKLNQGGSRVDGFLIRSVGFIRNEL